MRTLTMLERGFSTGKVSIGDLLSEAEPSVCNSVLSIPDLVDYMCRGGWPATLDENLRNAMEYVCDYVAEISRTDLQNMVGIRHDPIRLMRTMQSLARNISTEVALTTLASDTGDENNGVQTKTVANYLTSLSRLFFIEELPPFSPHLRSRSRLRKASKQYFTDQSLAIALLSLNPDRLLKNLQFLGLLFESLVVHELRVYAALHDVELSHYRDNTGLKIDVVLQTPSGQWMPIE